MAFAGLRGTGSFGTDERPKSFREMILWMNPNGSAPLFAMTAKAKTESVNDPEFSWWEELLGIARFIVNGALGSGDTTVVVASGALQLIEGDLLYVEPATEVAGFTQEHIRVVSVTNDTTFVVSRGQAGTTAAAIGNGLALLRVGNAQSEGDLSPGSASNNPTKYRNYTQIFKTPYTITKTALVPDYRTGDIKKNEQKRKSFEHSEKIEQALFWGTPYETVDATNGNMPIRFAGGLRNYITTNRKVYTADPTLNSLIADISPAFDFTAGNAGNERVIFAGNGALNFWNQLAINASNVQLNYDGPMDWYGMRLAKFVMPQGTVFMKSHPLLNQHPVFKYSMFVVNPSAIIYRPLKGRDTKLEKDIQPNDADYIKDQWITEAGFEFHYEQSMAYIGGVKDWP